MTGIPRVRTGWVDVDGVEVFYREAGHASAPLVLLLDGLPSSSFMFRDLIPRLADRPRCQNQLRTSATTPTELTCLPCERSRLARVWAEARPNRHCSLCAVARMQGSKEGLRGSDPNSPPGRSLRRVFRMTSQHCGDRDRDGRYQRAFSEHNSGTSWLPLLNHSVAQRRLMSR